MQPYPLPDPAISEPVDHAALAQVALAQAADLSDAGRETSPEGDAGLAPLTRPRTLCRAAQAGARLYRRETHLRLLGASLTTGGKAGTGKAGTGKGARAIVARLAEIEAACEAQRKVHAPDYAPRRHVLALSALIAERARMTRAGA